MNAGFLFAAAIVDLLTCGNLDYAEPIGGQPSRPLAAAALVDDERVAMTETPGVYAVRSRNLRKEGTSEYVWYRVIVDGCDLKCQCQDDKWRGVETRHDVMCVHILAAAYYAAMQKVWSNENE